MHASHGAEPEQRVRFVRQCSQALEVRRLYGSVLGGLIAGGA